MDQLKVILQHVKKHHFWLLCVVCLIAGVVGWNMAARKLSTAYTARKGEIEGKFSALDSIQNVENFPNARWAEEVEKLTKQEKSKVRRTWKSVYDEQATMLKWPDWTTPPPAEMPLSYREQYASKIASEFANLLAIVGADSHDASRAAALAAAEGNGKSKDALVREDKVIWDSGSQESLQKSLQLIAPSPLEVLLTQEDLWAYQVLLTVIKNVNAGKYVPPVKEISILSVAQKAADAFEKGLDANLIETPPTARATAQAGAGAAAAVESGMPGGAAPQPDEGRYLDRDGKRMRAGTAAKDQFKRLPIFMKLIVDQREIPKLLAECANSTLPIEVRQLRVNPTRGAAAAERSRSSSRAATDTAADRSSFEVPIEICGIIYIYNPPDVSKLGEEPDAEAAPAAAGAAPAAVAPGG